MTLEDRVVKVDEAMRKVGDILRRAVVDELQRLPDNWAGNGVLVAVGSSCGIVDRVFDRNSSLLGLFMLMEVGIIF